MRRRLPRLLRRVFASAELPAEELLGEELEWQREVPAEGAKPFHSLFAGQEVVFPEEEWRPGEAPAATPTAEILRMAELPVARENVVAYARRLLALQRRVVRRVELTRQVSYAVFNAVSANVWMLPPADLRELLQLFHASPAFTQQFVFPTLRKSLLAQLTAAQPREADLLDTVTRYPQLLAVTGSLSQVSADCAELARVVAQAEGRDAAELLLRLCFAAAEAGEVARALYLAHVVLSSFDYKRLRLRLARLFRAKQEAIEHGLLGLGWLELGIYHHLQLTEPQIDLDRQLCAALSAAGPLTVFLRVNGGSLFQASSETLTQTWAFLDQKLARWIARVARVCRTRSGLEGIWPETEFFGRLSLFLRCAAPSVTTLNALSECLQDIVRSELLWNCFYQQRSALAWLSICLRHPRLYEFAALRMDQREVLQQLLGGFELREVLFVLPLVRSDTTLFKQLIRHVVNAFSSTEQDHALRIALVCAYCQFHMYVSHELRERINAYLAALDLEAVSHSALQRLFVATSVKLVELANYRRLARFLEVAEDDQRYQQKLFYYAVFNRKYGVVEEGDAPRVQPLSSSPTVA